MIELFVRGVVLCLLTATALILFRRTAAAYRHLMCVLALLGLLILPFAQRFLPPLQLLPSQSAVASKRITAPLKAAVRFSPRSSEIPASQAVPQEPILRTKLTLLPPGSGPAARSMATLDPTHRQPRSRNAALVLLAVWGIGAVALLIRLLVALFRLRRLEADSCKAMLDNVPVRISEQVQTPLTWGIRRSVILLPAALLTGDRAVCDSALRHEKAHIARWDWLWNLLAEIVCAFCWFQPGAWWLRSRMRLESERACDDRVLLSGVAGPDYAAHLLQILRMVGSNEVAPAMAQSQRGMEERMRHILDGAKPRNAPIQWLAVSAPCAFALLSLAALRVSAKPAEAKRPTDKGTAAMNSNRSASRPSKAADPAEKSATPGGLATGHHPLHRADSPQVNARPAPTLDNVRPAVLLEKVIWGKVMDGLEPGFLLNKPALPNQVVPFNSQVSYQVLVRNTTDSTRAIEVRCLNTDEMDIPYLISSDEISAAFDGREIPQQFRAKWTSSPLDGLDGVFPAYVVKLAPGEAVVVPGEFGLYVGDAQKQVFPRIEKIKPEMSWIVQPITIHSLTLAEAARTQAAPSSVAQTVTVVNRKGKASQRSATTVPAQDFGTKLYAKIQLEVGTLGAEAVRNADKSVWGKADKGMQCGIRLLTSQHTFHVGDTIQAELLWRNVSHAAITSTLPRPLDFWALVHDEKGQSLQIDTGARTNFLPGFHTYEPGEIQSLGVFAVKLVEPGTPSPKSNFEPGQISLGAGVYKLSGLGGVGDPDPESGSVTFQVVGAPSTGKQFRARIQNEVGTMRTAQNQPPATTQRDDASLPAAASQEPDRDKPIQWGKIEDGFQLGARIVHGHSIFNTGDTIAFQTFGRNLSGKDVRLTVGNYWKVNYKIQVQASDGKPIYMERNERNRPMEVAGYLLETLVQDAEEPISEAMLNICPPPKNREAVRMGEEGAWAEMITLKPGRYRVRIVSCGVFGRRSAEPTSSWIPIEVKN